jgi:hypothetical protein
VLKDKQQLTCCSRVQSTTKLAQILHAKAWQSQARGDIKYTGIYG